jgi:hypothetical protein
MIDPKDWPVVGIIDRDGTLSVPGRPSSPWLNPPPAQIVVAAEEQHHFELEIRIKAHNQPDAVLHREMTSKEKASTDGALGEFWGGVSPATKAKMRDVDSDK